MTPAPYPDFDGTQACAGVDAELFFPSAGDYHDSLPVAQMFCAGCPWLRPCLAHALSYDLHGIWGGTSQAQRQALQDKHGITPLPVQIGLVRSGRGAARTTTTETP